jgi:hypothetical protein
MAAPTPTQSSRIAPSGDQIADLGPCQSIRGPDLMGGGYTDRDLLRRATQGGNGIRDLFATHDNFSLPVFSERPPARRGIRLSTDVPLDVANDGSGGRRSNDWVKKTCAQARR